MVKMQCRKMPNWKAPGKDAVLGYWLKNLTSLHPRITVRLILSLMEKDHHQIG